MTLWYRGVPSGSLETGGGGADIGVSLNYSTTIEIPLGPSSATACGAEEC